jgi:hypothetical protein
MRLGIFLSIDIKAVALDRLTLVKKIKSTKN